MRNGRKAKEKCMGENAEKGRVRMLKEIWKDRKKLKIKEIRQKGRRGELRKV